MTYDYVIKASYGNDSIALIQWAYEAELENVAVLYNDTGWSTGEWSDRIYVLEIWVESLGFAAHRTKSVGLEQLVRDRKGWPRQGIQFCTGELKMKPTIDWLASHDPVKNSVVVIGVRRSESANRAQFPQWSVDRDSITTWAPLVNYDDEDRNALLVRAGIDPLPHRSDECFPCVNSNRADLRRLDEQTIAKIETIEKSMGSTPKGAPRTMFRPYRYMGATGIREIVRWANSERGEFNLDDGHGSSGCEAGWCGI